MVFLHTRLGVMHTLNLESRLQFKFKTLVRVTVDLLELEFLNQGHHLVLIRILISSLTTSTTCQGRSITNRLNLKTKPKLLDRI